MANVGNMRLSLLLLAASAAFGNTIAFTPPSGLSLTSGGAVNLGLIFTANANISVDALGFYDLSDDLNSATVGLFDASGNLLASQVVSPGVAVSGYFYQSITPVNLVSGHVYVVDELSSDGRWAYGGTGPPTTDPSITYTSHAYDYTSTLTFPTNTAARAATAYYGPNFEFTPTLATVPEPASLGLIAVGAAGLLFRARRRRAASRS